MVHAELASRGFISQDDENLALADTLFDLPAHERDSVIALFTECHRQTLLGSSLCRIGGPSELPTVVGPGGLSVLFPLPLLSMTDFCIVFWFPSCCFCLDFWPDLSNSAAASRTHAKLLECLRLTASALTVSQWIQFDEEASQGGVEEACLFAIRLVSCNSDLPLELPILWSRFRADEAVAAINLLLSEVGAWFFPPFFFSQLLIIA